MGEQNDNNDNADKGTGNDGGSDAFDFRSLITDDGTFVEDWPNRLPEDMKAEIGEGKYFGQIKDPLSLIKSTHGLSKLAGRPTIPGENATQEDWDKFFDRIPRPKEGEGYGFDLDQFQDERFKKFAEKTGYLTNLERILAKAGVPATLAARIATADAE
jgi:hypothetical protein